MEKSTNAKQKDSAIRKKAKEILKKWEQKLNEKEGEVGKINGRKKNK